MGVACPGPRPPRLITEPDFQGSLPPYITRPAASRPILCILSPHWPAPVPMDFRNPRLEAPGAYAHRWRLQFWFLIAAVNGPMNKLHPQLFRGWLARHLGDQPRTRTILSKNGCWDLLINIV